MTYYPRWLYTALAGSSSVGKVRLIFGARQTGKSTLMHRLVTAKSVYINLQERGNRLNLERSPSIFTQQLRAREEKRISVFVDEIQKVPALLDEVQYLFDEHPDRFDFFLTGSSARRLRVSSANLLPGRSHLYHLCPLILPERKGRRTSRIFPLGPLEHFEPGFPTVKLEECLLYGNLPGVSLESVESRARTLESYVEVYLEEEIRREALVRNMGAFQQFLELAAAESGHIINLTALSQEAGVPVATLRTFYQVLEDTFTGYRIPAFGVRGRKRVLTTPRFLFFDLGVRNAAARFAFSDTLVRTQAGQLFENWVGLELIHRCLYAGRSFRVSFWRTAYQAEVDYILETPGEVIPIEVKWTETPRETDARHLKQFLSAYSDNAKRGYIVCRCPEALQITENIQAVPWTDL